MDSQMTIHFEVSPSERCAYDTAYWIRDNGESFRALMRFLHQQVDSGNPRTTRDDVMAYARDNRLTITVLDGLVRDHNLYACATRFAVMLRPRLCKTVRFRKSALDEVDLVSIWHETVNPNTTFLAKDRFEAERLVDMNDASAA